VPRLARHLDDNAESDDSSSVMSQKSSGGNRKSRQIVEVVGSSSSSSPVEEYIPEASSRRRSSQRSSRKRQQVDRSCSPIQSIQENVFGWDLVEQSDEPLPERHSIREPVGLVSAAVQTDAIKIDASTKTPQFSNSGSLTSTPNSIDKTSTSKTSSSMISSEHSVGQISIQRAAFLTSRSNFRIVTIRRDGSIQPTFNVPIPLSHSTPVRTTVRDMTPQEMQAEEPERSFTHFQQVMGSSSESPLVAQEQTIHSSSGTRTQLSEVVEDLPEDVEASAEEEDVSTLNQISPLPTG